MALNIQQAEGLLLQGAKKVYQEMRTPTTHMTGFFKKQMYNSTLIPLSIMRDNDIIAADVMRGTSGNMNQISKWSEKEILPPQYDEVFLVNQLRSYERGFGQSSTMLTTDVRAEISKEIAMQILKLENKIKRAIEKQCSEALETGIVLLKNGDSIDYKRKAGSLASSNAIVDNKYWNEGADIERQLQYVGNWMRVEGATELTVIDATMSASNWILLQSTEWFKTKANYQNVTLLSIGNPQGRNGATFHGQITAGAYIYRIWVYDATFLNTSNVRTRYYDETKVIFTPAEGSEFELAFGAIDTIVKSSGADAMSGQILQKQAMDFYVYDSIDTKLRTREIHVVSAPAARLITVDQVFTLKTVAAFGSEIIG